MNDGVSAGSAGDRLVVVSFEGEDRPTWDEEGEGEDESTTTRGAKGDEFGCLGKKDMEHEDERV